MSAENALSLRACFPSKGWGDGQRVPSDMKGAEILFIGSCAESAELVIDYRTKGGVSKRIVLGFTELGMWIENAPHLLPIRDV